MTKAPRVPITIVGSGVVGCALANELSKSVDDVVVIEANSHIRGENQSSRNSGVVHAGIYYDKKVSPLKAELCVEGGRMLYQFGEQHDIPIRKTGKLLIAVDQREEEYLEDVERVATENHVPGVRFLSIDQAREFEPNVSGHSALYVPTSGIIEATSLVSKLYALASEQGAIFMFGSKVVNIRPKPSSFEITTVTIGGGETSFESEIVINAAGLYSDEIARMVNPSFPFEIDPVRGESAKFYRNRRTGLWLNGMNVYPAPYVYYNSNGEPARVSLQESRQLCQDGLATKTVGIHLTPTFDDQGNIADTVTIGPAKTVGRGKHDYGSGLRPPEYYHQGVHSFYQELRVEDVELHQAGIMAVLKGHPDWHIARDEKYHHLVNCVGLDSPALTAVFAIVRYVKQEVLNVR